MPHRDATCAPPVIWNEREAAYAPSLSAMQLRRLSVVGKGPRVVWLSTRPSAIASAIPSLDRQLRPVSDARSPRCGRLRFGCRTRASGLNFPSDQGQCVSVAECRHHNVLPRKSLTQKLRKSNEALSVISA